MRRSTVRITTILGFIILGLLFMPPAASAGHTPGPEKITEKAITMDQLPQAVKTAILEAAGSHRIREIEMITGADGTVTYEAEWKVDGKEVEIEVSPDGTVLQSETEDDDRPDDPDDDDGVDDDDEDDRPVA